MKKQKKMRLNQLKVKGFVTTDLKKIVGGLRTETWYNC